MSAQDEKKPPVGGMDEVAAIVITVQANGHARLVSTCHGAPDSSCVPLPDYRVPAEVAKLLGELRSRVALSRF